MYQATNDGNTLIKGYVHVPLLGREGTILYMWLTYYQKI